jgi:hypothetical protein
MKNIIYSLAFMLITSFAYANENVTNKIVNKEITAYNLDGKSYSPEEFNKLNLLELKEVKECTITITITVETPLGPITFTTTETFEASWFGCLMAKVGAFLASIWRPSV